MRTTDDRTLAPTGRSRATTDRYPWGRVLGAFALMSVALTAVVAWPSRSAAPGSRLAMLQGPTWLDAWFQYDAGWYYGIAESGYFYNPGQQSSIAFFPVFPMTVRALGWVTGDYQVAGTLLAVAAGGASLALFGRWAWSRLPRPAALTALLVLASTEWPKRKCQTMALPPTVPVMARPATQTTSAQ